MTSTEEVRRRIQFIEEVERFVQSCQNELTTVLETLGWSPDCFVQQKIKLQCPHDPSHVMSPEALEKHKPVCSLKSQGVPKEVAEDESKQSSKFFYMNSNNIATYKLDKESLNSVLWNHHVKEHTIFYGYNKLPLTTEDEEVTLTPGERAALYDYFVQRAKTDGKMANLEQDMLLTANLEELVKKKNLEGDNSKPKSYLEYLQTMRDYKRRRQSYRAKNVHITKKSYTEIIREVIENQTDYLTEILREDVEEKVDTEEREKDKQTSSTDYVEQPLDRTEDAGYDRKRRRSRSRSVGRIGKHREREDIDRRSRSRSVSRRRRSRSRHRDNDRRRKDNYHRERESREMESRKKTVDERRDERHSDSYLHSNSPDNVTSEIHTGEKYGNSDSDYSESSHRERKKHKKNKKHKHKHHKESK